MVQLFAIFFAVTGCRWRPADKDDYNRYEIPKNEHYPIKGNPVDLFYKECLEVTFTFYHAEYYHLDSSYQDSYNKVFGFAEGHGSTITDCFSNPNNGQAAMIGWRWYDELTGDYAIEISAYTHYGCKNDTPYYAQPLFAIQPFETVKATICADNKHYDFVFRDINNDTIAKYQAKRIKSKARGFKSLIGFYFGGLYPNPSNKAILAYCSYRFI